jgi:hypothetical protein
MPLTGRSTFTTRHPINPPPRLLSFSSSSSSSSVAFRPSPSFSRHPSRRSALISSLSGVHTHARARSSSSHRHPLETSFLHPALPLASAKSSFVPPSRASSLLTHVHDRALRSPTHSPQSSQPSPESALEGPRGNLEILDQYSPGHNQCSQRPFIASAPRPPFRSKVGRYYIRGGVPKSGAREIRSGLPDHTHWTTRMLEIRSWEPPL